MSEPHPLLLWKRVTQALSDRNALVEGSPGDIAAHARRVLGTDLVERFLQDYYLERQFGGGTGRLSDAAAERLVHDLEALPRGAPAPLRAPGSRPPMPSPVVPSGAPAGAAGPPVRVPTDLEEAEAYGQDNEVTRRFASLDALRHLCLNLRAERRAWQEAQRRRQQHSEEEAQRRHSEQEQTAAAEAQTVRMRPLRAWVLLLILGAVIFLSFWSDTLRDYRTLGIEELWTPSGLRGDRMWVGTVGTVFGLLLMGCGVLILRAKAAQTVRMRPLRAWVLLIIGAVIFLPSWSDTIPSYRIPGIKELWTPSPFIAKGHMWVGTVGTVFGLLLMGCGDFILRAKALGQLPVRPGWHVVQGLKFGGSLLGSYFGLRVGCDNVFFTLAVRAYQNDLMRAITATHYCADDSAFFAPIAVIVGALVVGPLAERRWWAAGAVVGAFPASFLAEVLPGFAYDDSAFFAPIAVIVAALVVGFLAERRWRAAGAVVGAFTASFLAEVLPGFAYYVKLFGLN